MDLKSNSLHIWGALQNVLKGGKSVGHSVKLLSYNTHAQIVHSL